MLKKKKINNVKKEESFASSCFLEAQYCAMQAQSLLDMQEKFLQLWAKTKCPYKIGEKLKLPKKMWDDKDFVFFEGFIEYSPETEFVITNITYSYNGDYNIIKDTDDRNLEWSIIVRESRKKSKKVHRVCSYYFKGE